mmetsp:Transcript_15187/g.35310  ORF Transcript_15187/g.35310 Transcript_15187/m.35310 type:complete len:271 (-) Transcript_15187:456-1268(-)
MLVILLRLRVAFVVVVAVVVFVFVVVMTVVSRRSPGAVVRLIVYITVRYLDGTRTDPKQRCRRPRHRRLRGRTQIVLVVAAVTVVRCCIHPSRRGVRRDERLELGLELTHQFGAGSRALGQLDELPVFQLVLHCTARGCLLHLNEPRHGGLQPPLRQRDTLQHGSLLRLVHRVVGVTATTPVSTPELPFSDALGEGSSGEDDERLIGAIDSVEIEPSPTPELPANDLRQNAWQSGSSTSGSVGRVSVADTAISRPLCVGLRGVGRFNVPK